MQTHITGNCGNSPRSLLAIEVAVNLASSEYDKLEPLLAEGFTWSVAGSDVDAPRRIDRRGVRGPGHRPSRAAAGVRV